MQSQPYILFQSPPYLTDEEDSGDSDGAALQGSAWFPPAYINLPALDLRDTSHTGGYQQSHQLTNVNNKVPKYEVAAYQPDQYTSTLSSYGDFNGDPQGPFTDRTINSAGHVDRHIFHDAVPATSGWETRDLSGIPRTAGTFHNGGEAPLFPDMEPAPLPHGKHLCPTCRKPFSKPSNLSRHVKTVHQKEIHICNYEGCISFFGRSDHLKEHQKIHKKPVQNGSFTCPSCKMTFKTKAALTKHAPICQGGDGDKRDGN